MSNEIGLYLGPLFGFLFTTGTLLFIVFNAHRTAKIEGHEIAPPATEPAAPEAVPATETPAEQPEARS